MLYPILLLVVTRFFRVNDLAPASEEEDDGEELELVVVLDEVG